MFNEEQAVELLKQVMQIPTVGADEALVVDVLVARLVPLIADGSVTVERLPYAAGRDNLILNYGPATAKTKLGIDGHMDVVDAGDPAKWMHAPFAAEISGGKMWGRGASDMKAGLIAAFVAFCNVATNKTPVKSQLRFFATVGEEVDNYGARQLAAGGYTTDLSGLLVCEPSGPQIQPTSRGIIDYTVTAKGKAAHSSTPEAGANAIEGLFAFHTVVMGKTAPLTALVAPMLGHATHSITLIDGGNQVNIIPESASLRGNIRTTPVADNALFTAALTTAVAEANAQLDGVVLTLSIDSTLDSVGSDPDNWLVNAVQTARQGIGLDKVPVVGGTGICDAALMLNDGMDMAEYGPGSNTSHQTDEYVELEDFANAIKVYEDIFANY